MKIQGPTQQYSFISLPADVANVSPNWSADWLNADKLAAYVMKEENNGYIVSK
jgi:hypothetical protein